MRRDWNLAETRRVLPSRDYRRSINVSKGPEFDPPYLADTSLTILQPQFQFLFTSVSSFLCHSFPFPVAICVRQFISPPPPPTPHPPSISRPHFLSLCSIVHKSHPKLQSPKRDAVLQWSEAVQHAVQDAVHVTLDLISDLNSTTGFSITCILRNTYVQST